MRSRSYSTIWWSDTYCYQHSSEFIRSKKKPQKNTLNKNRPRLDPCRIQKSISLQDLHHIIHFDSLSLFPFCYVRV